MPKNKIKEIIQSTKTEDALATVVIATLVGMAMFFYFYNKNPIVGANLLVAVGTGALAYMTWKILRRATEPNLIAIFTMEKRRKPELLPIAVVNVGEIPVIIHSINIIGISTGKNLQAKMDTFYQEDERQISYNKNLVTPLDILSPRQKWYATLVCLKDDVFRKEEGYRLEVEYSGKAKKDKRKIARDDYWVTEPKQRES